MLQDHPPGFDVLMRELEIISGDFTQYLAFLTERRGWLDGLLAERPESNN